MTGAPSVQGRRVGRLAELREIADALEVRPGLITLVGPGGVGKTRLALEVARERQGLFVELAPVRGAGALADALVSRLGLGGRPGAATVRIVEALERRGYGLVILDNLEQLIPEVGPELTRLIRAAPGIRWLVTSRRPVGLAGERAIRIGPLPPADAEALFVDRAPALSLDGLADRTALALVLERLDGMPLALELAAARLEIMTLPRLAERLEHHLGVLARPEQVGQRHGSMAGVLDASWELLAPGIAEALAQLSVFRGGFSIDSAEGVVEVDGVATLDAVHVLTRHSLVVPEAMVDGRTRFSLLELVRTHAAGKLDAAAARHARDRHLRWFVDAAWSWVRDADGRERLRRNRANLLVAHRRALAQGSPQALALAGLLHEILVETMAYEDHQALLDQTIAAFEPLPDTSDAARALLGQGYLQLLRRDAALALRTLAQAEATAVAAGDLDLELDAATYATFAESVLGQPEQRKARLRSIVERAPPGHLQAINAQIRLANLEVWVGRPDRACALMEPHATQVHARTDRVAAFFGYSYGRSLGDVGDVTGAETWWRVAVSVSTALQIPFVAPEVRSGLAAVLHTTDRPDEARSVLEPALVTARADPDHHQLTWLIAALVALDDGRIEEAAAGLDIASRAGAHNDQGRFQAALAWLGLILVHALRGDGAAAAQAWTQVETRLPDVAMLRRPQVSSLLAGARALASEPPDLPAALRGFAAAAPGFPRLLAHVGRRVIRQLQREARSVHIDAAGGWIQPPDRPRHDLSRRASLSRITAAFAASQGQPLTVAALFAVGWPGETAAEDAARSRVYVALSTLRKAGLPIERTADGYRLGEAVVVR